MKDKTNSIPTTEKYAAMFKVFSQGWKIDSENLFIHRDIDGQKMRLDSCFDTPDEIAKTLESVWKEAWPAVKKNEEEISRLQNLVEKAYLRGAMFAVSEMCRQRLHISEQDAVDIIRSIGTWDQCSAACDGEDLKHFARTVGKAGLKRLGFVKK